MPIEELWLCKRCKQKITSQFGKREISQREHNKTCQKGDLYQIIGNLDQNIVIPPGYRK